jgi:hypothetical protein
MVRTPLSIFGPFTTTWPPTEIWLSSPFRTVGPVVAPPNALAL